jgi:hypothetical protein
MKARDRFQIGGAARLRGLAFGRRGGTTLPRMAAIWFFAVGAMAATTNELSEAEIQGWDLVRQLREQQPAENSTNTGVLKIRDGKGRRSEVPVKCEARVTAANWASRYEAAFSNRVEMLLVVHATGRPNQYFYHPHFLDAVPRLGNIPLGHISPSHELAGADAMIPFAGSDFWVADLGLEFFHWPGQKVLKHELRRGRACTVLESTNPDPSANGYSRVVSWIDHESGGIVQAEAYDANGRLLKEFNPRSFKKLNGQWELQEMEIRNVQTGSRTRLEFEVPEERVGLKADCPNRWILRGARRILNPPPPEGSVLIELLSCRRPAPTSDVGVKAPISSRRLDATAQLGYCRPEWALDNGGAVAQAVRSWNERPVSSEFSCGLRLSRFQRWSGTAGFCRRNEFT